MKSFLSPLIIGLFIILSLACGTGRTTGDDGVVRSASDVPDLFDPPVGMTWGDNNCKNPIIDPMDGTELILVHSRDGMGDYRVTGRKYGVSKGELLRINCYTGAVLGIVRGR